jgi:hypothetical protein
VAERIRADIRHAEKRPLSTRTSPSPTSHRASTFSRPVWRSGSTPHSSTSAVVVQVARAFFGTLAGGGQAALAGRRRCQRRPHLPAAPSRVKLAGSRCPHTPPPDLSLNAGSTTRARTPLRLHPWRVDTEAPTRAAGSGNRRSTQIAQPASHRRGTARASIGASGLTVRPGATETATKSRPISAPLVLAPAPSVSRLGGPSAFRRPRQRAVCGALPSTGRDVSVGRYGGGERTARRETPGRPESPCCLASARRAERTTPGRGDRHPLEARAFEFRSVEAPHRGP